MHRMKPFGVYCTSMAYYHVRHFVYTRISCVPQSCTDAELDDVILNISTSPVEDPMNDSEKHSPFLVSDPARGLGRGTNEKDRFNVHFLNL